MVGCGNGSDGFQVQGDRGHHLKRFDVSFWDFNCLGKNQWGWWGEFFFQLSHIQHLTGMNDAVCLQVFTTLVGFSPLPR